MPFVTVTGIMYQRIFTSDQSSSSRKEFSRKTPMDAIAYTEVKISKKIFIKDGKENQIACDSLINCFSGAHKIKRGSQVYEFSNKKYVCVNHYRTMPTLENVQSMFSLRRYKDIQITPLED